MYRLRSNLSLIPMEDGVQLRAGDEDVFVLRGDRDRLTAALDQLVVGSSIEQLVDVVGAPPDWLRDVLDALSAENLLELVPETSSKQEMTVTDEELFGQIEVVGDGPIAAVFNLLLGRTEIGNANENGKAPKRATSPTAMIVAWDRPHLSFVTSANRNAIANQLPCLFVDLSHGRHATLGPFFIPGEGACFECYRQWWRRNSQALNELDAAHQHMLETQLSLRPYGNSNAERHWVAAMAVVELTAFLHRNRPLRTLNRQITVDLDHLTTHSEPVWRIPWCSACGSLHMQSHRNESGLGKIDGR